MNHIWHGQPKWARMAFAPKTFIAIAFIAIAGIGYAVLSGQANLHYQQKQIKKNEKSRP